MRVGRNDPCPCGSGKKYKYCHGRRQSTAPVLYVHPAKQAVDLHADGAPLGRPYGLIPVGIPALASLLRENGIAVQGVNYPLERSIDPAFDLRRWLARHDGARIVLIDLHWYEHSYGAIQVARVCKEVLPEAWTVLGGFTASAFSREILESFPEVDFIIRGDAEKPLLAVAQRLLGRGIQSAEPTSLEDIPNLSYRKGDHVMENGLAYCAATADLDALEFADISFLEHHAQYHAHEYIVTDLERARQMYETNPFRGRWLCTARGCRYECSYCGGCRSAHKTLAGREGVITRSPARVVDDLKRLQERGVVQASLSYDIAELGEAYWREFFSLLRGSGVKIGLYNELFQLPKPEFVEEFVQSVDLAHSCLALSPLSGSERVRRLNGKHFSNEELFDVLDLLGRYNVYIFVYFSLNLPGEDNDILQQTTDLAERVYDFYPPSLLKILSSCHTLDPLSPMSVHPERFAIEVKIRTFADYYAYCRDTQFASPESRSELHRGFQPLEGRARSLEAMADAWDAARLGRESSWWPIPPGW